MEILLIRHGQSEQNLFNIDQTKSIDLPKDVSPDAKTALTALGKEQAKKLGQVLADLFELSPEILSAFFCSDWDRAVQTLVIILEQMNLLKNYEISSALTDQKLGLTDPYLVVNYPDVLNEPYDEYWIRRRGNPEQRMNKMPIDTLTAEMAEIVEAEKLEGPNIYGENLSMVVSRVEKWFKEQIPLWEKNKIQRVVIVGHGGSIYASLGALLDYTNEQIIEFMEEHDVGNVSITKYLRDDETGNWVLTKWAQELIN